MPIFDIFKQKKEEKIKPEVKPVKKVAKKVKPARKSKEARVEKPSEAVTPIGKKEKKFFETYKILKAPQITEKATELSKKNQYVFKVWPRANKTEIKKAIESLYGVEVVSVKIIKVPPKPRRLGRISGFRKGYKKAIVKIKEGQKIEILPR